MNLRMKSIETIPCRLSQPPQDKKLLQDWPFGRRPFKVGGRFVTPDEKLLGKNDDFSSWETDVGINEFLFAKKWSGQNSKQLQQEIDAKKVEQRMQELEQKGVEVTEEQREEARSAVGNPSEDQEWDTLRFDLRLPVSDIVALMNKNVDDSDNDFKSVSTSFADMKVKRASVVSSEFNVSPEAQAENSSQPQKASSAAAAKSFTNCDLLDIVCESTVNVNDSPSAEDDLINTSNLLSVLVVVPDDRQKEFKSFYEGRAQEENVVPRSEKQLLKVGQDKDKAWLYRVVLFAPQGTDEKGKEAARAQASDKFKKACRDVKFTVRDYPFTKQWHEDQNKERHTAMAKFRLEHFKLLEKGHSIFSDMFQLWVHVKILRAVLDCVLRYGFCVQKGVNKMPALLVAPDPPQMVQFHKDLAQTCGDQTEKVKLNEGGKSSEEDANPYTCISLVPLSSSLS
jgi:hypothetical protein